MSVTRARAPVQPEHRRRRRSLASAALLALASTLLFGYGSVDLFADRTLTLGLLPAFIAARAVGPAYGAVVAGAGALAWQGPLIAPLACTVASLEVLIVSTLAQRLRPLPSSIIDASLWLLASSLLWLSTSDEQIAARLDLLGYLWCFAINGALNATVAALLLAVPARRLFRGRWMERVRVPQHEVASSLGFLLLALPMVGLALTFPPWQGLPDYFAAGSRALEHTVRQLQGLATVHGMLAASGHDSGVAAIDVALDGHGCSLTQDTKGEDNVMTCAWPPASAPGLGIVSSAWHQRWLRPEQHQHARQLAFNLPGFKLRIEPELDNPQFIVTKRNTLIVGWVRLAMLLAATTIPLHLYLGLRRLHLAEGLSRLESAAYQGDRSLLEPANLDVRRTLVRMAGRLRQERALKQGYENQLSQILMRMPIVLANGYGDALTGRFRLDLLRAGQVEMNSHILTDTECLESDWWLRRIHPDDADVYVRAGRTLMHRDVWRGRYRAYSKRRGWRTFQVDVQVTERISAAEIGFISFAIDITERTLIEEREQGTARLITMGRIAAGIAHELNQPLNVIRLAAENAVIASADPAAGNYVRTRLARIKEQVTRAEKITGQLRVLGRTPADTSELFDVGEALLTAVDLVEQDLLAVGVPVIYQGAPPAAMLRGPRQLFEQSVINLVLNARDSVLERRQRGIVVPTGDWVELLAVNDGEGNVRISVRDTGTGIPPDALPHIFEAFFTTKEVDKGSGLGLSIVHSTITGMGGEIIASNHQAGACFELVFKSDSPGNTHSPTEAWEGSLQTDDSAAQASPLLSVHQTPGADSPA